MQIKQLLVERVVNLFHNQLKAKYSDEVWEILQRSYAAVPGGFGTADSPDELIEKSSLWKMVVRDGKVTAVSIYRDQYGRKSIAAGTDGSLQGKRDYGMIKTEDMKFRRSWAEVSGAPERMAQKAGMDPVPHKYAAALTKKEIIEYNDDGYHYTRLIGGQPHEKIIYGSFDLSPLDIDRLISFGIDLEELPAHFKPVG